MFLCLKRSELEINSLFVWLQGLDNCDDSLRQMWWISDVTNFQTFHFVKLCPIFVDTALCLFTKYNNFLKIPINFWLQSLTVTTVCGKCGGFRMLPCPICDGSKKSMHRNDFTEQFIALRCTVCDDCGLVKCDKC